MTQSKQDLENPDTLSPDTGLDALRASSEFNGPVEIPDEHDHGSGESNDHLASIYDCQEEQFAAAIPFIEQGLERGERCLYVADENSPETIREAMRSYGLDVDAALESGALSIHTKMDTYLQTGEFDTDAMVEFWKDSLDRATAEDEYEGIRAAAEMTWAVDSETGLDQLTEYEAILNTVYPGEDYTVMCQYNRERFPPEVVRDVIRTHPHLVIGSTVYHNVYYTPPEEFFGPENAEREVERMMGTLQVGTEMKTELQDNHQYLREQNEIMADPDRPFEEKLQAVFELGCERFDLELGAMARVDPENDRFEIEYTSDDHEHFEQGVELPLSETYCVEVTGDASTASVSNPAEDGYGDITVHREFGLNAYLGTYVEVEGGRDRTFFFVSSRERDIEFTEEERTFHRQMGQWVKFELERTQRERLLRESYEISSDPDRSFEEKLEGLFDLGRERFDLEMAGLNHLPSRDGSSRLEHGVGLGVDSGQELWTDPGEGCFCRRTMEAGKPVSVTDVTGTDWADDDIHKEFGLTTYLGTEVTVGGSSYGSLWFGSTEPHDRPFTDEERTYLELVADWVGTELERLEHNRYQRELYELAADADDSFEEKLDALFELGCERFDLELGGMARIDRERDTFEVERVSGEHDYLVPGEMVELSETYCRVLDQADTAVGVTDPVDDGFGSSTAYAEFGVKSYLGTRLSIDGDVDRSLFFVSSDERDRPFTEAERTFHRLMGQWVAFELERRQRERQQRELYNVTSNSSLTFDEKVDRLLELGCQRLDLGVGMYNYDHGESFEIVRMRGDHPDIGQGAFTPPSTKNYCRRVIKTGEQLAVSDAEAAGWTDDDLYAQFDLKCYAGSLVTVGEERHGTLCFTDLEPREREFTSAELTFIEQMAQALSYELERKQREDHLGALNALSRELMDAETCAEVAERLVSAAPETLGLPYAAVGLYDDEQGVLRPAAATEAGTQLLERDSLFDVDGGVGWTAFARNEVTREQNCSGEPSLDGYPNVSELAVLPLGSHGVLVTASTATDGFHPTEFDYAETVAATVNSALDRAHREQQIHERERELTEQNEALGRLNRINDIIRSIDQSLVQASNREEVASVVCDRLASDGPYELAWISEHDPITGDVRPWKWSDGARDYLDDIDATDDGAGCPPARRAVETREPQVTNDILGEPPLDPWREAALRRGYHASIALPLVYKDTLFGVLNVYAGQTEVFDDLERSVLVELSDNIAYAINAVENKRSLVSDEVTELEFTVSDTDFEVVHLVEEAGCTFVHENIVPQTNGGLREFFYTRGATADDVLSLEPRLPYTDLTLISEREEDGEAVCLFEAELTDECLPAAVLDHGGRIHEIRADGDDATVTVDLATDRSVRSFVEMFQTKYAGSEMVSKHTSERPSETLTEFRTSLVDDLTPRQLEVLQTAHQSGYFEKPRFQTGSEIAERMDISQPTFNNHLRYAQRKLYRRLFETEPVSQ